MGKSRQTTDIVITPKQMAQAVFPEHNVRMSKCLDMFANEQQKKLSSWMFSDG